MELMSTSLLAGDSNLITFHSFPLNRSPLNESRAIGSKVARLSN
jgi:hypothetical protein